MTVRVNKQPFNLREKLSELERPIGVKGSELIKAETAQDARDVISAGRKNMIINGAMQVAQRATSKTNITSSGYFTLDRHQIAFYPQGAVLTESRSTDSPVGFAHSRKIEVTTAGNSSTWFLLSYKFEGQDVQSLAKGTANAKSATLSFWVKTNAPGKYAVELIDGDNSRQVSFPYYINTANTWQKIEITFPPDTTGAFTSDNTESLQISWFLSAGSTFTGGSMTGNWRANSNSNRAVGINQFTNVVGNEFYITGIQLEVGKNATDFEYRSYGEELALCQRYFIRMKGSTGDHGTSVGDGGIATLANWTTQNAYGPIFLGTEMRTAPSLAGFSGVKYFSGGNQTSLSGSNVAIVGTMTNRVELRLIGLSNLLQGGAGWVRLGSTSDYMDFNAEL